MQMKYVMIMVNGISTPFIFPETVQHADFVHMIGRTRDDVIGAGFVGYDELTPYGESISLRKDGSDPEVEYRFDRINNPY